METFDSGAFYVLLGPRANLDQEPCQNSSTTTNNDPFNEILVSTMLA
jgi:hypothetical protein